MRIPAMRGGRLSISFPSGQDSGRYARITVQCESSRVEFLEVEVSMEEFALALSSLAMRPCEFRTRGLDLIGTRYEHKSELVEFTEEIDRLRNLRDDLEVGPRGKAVRTVLAAYETDGWQGRDSDASNRHNRAKSASPGHVAYRVHFSRYVADDAPAPEAPLGVRRRGER